MERREFLASGVALTALMRVRSVLSQTANSRAAVVIGVNNCGSLPVLTDAVAGAIRVSNWLKDEGFTVKTFVDTEHDVHVGDIYSAVKDLADLGTIEQLVVYFSGHGINVHRDEHWFLSEATENPNQSISVRNSIDSARWTGISNVVFISDACRTPPAQYSLQQIHGGVIFPPPKPTSTDVEIDRFFATLPGNPAYELSFRESKNKHGVFTTAFLDAFRSPDANMVSIVEGIRVVPNRALKDYLIREVPRRVQNIDLTITQQPQSIIESDQDTYIGRAAQIVTPGPPSASPSASPPAATIADVVDYLLMEEGLAPVGMAEAVLASEAQLETLSSSTGFRQARDTILQASRDDRGRRQFETQTGLNIYGTQLAGLETVPPGLHAGTVAQGDSKGAPVILRLEPIAGSAVLRFEDGSGSIVAILPGYIGTIVVNASGVTSVSYEPSENSDRYVDDELTQWKLRELRAAIAVTIQSGGFHFQGNKDTRSFAAAEFADRIRMFNSIDPALGLYAAYAFAEAGLTDDVKTLHEMMRKDLSRPSLVQGQADKLPEDIFDIAMLAGKLSDTDWDERLRTVPICPMLSQGWGLLRARGVSVPKVLRDAQTYLRPSLWTTFTSEIMDRLEDIARSYPYPG